MNRKVIGIILGDPAGVGPEITCKTLSNINCENEYRVVIVGSEASLLKGMEVSGIRLNYIKVSEVHSLRNSIEPITLYELEDFRDEDLIPGHETAKNGMSMIKMLEAGIDLVVQGVIDGIVYAPLNKNAINLADKNYSDELEVFLKKSNFKGLALEMNYSSEIWTTRVTGHIPLMKVASYINENRILDVIRLTNSSLMKSGILEPILYVSALNPHGGEGGLFGDEEIKIIAPAVALAAAEGIIVKGPFPADTVFNKAFSGDCDAVVTMYHDQGQIALKTKSFGEGVTYLAGLPFVAITVGHGVGYDIAFKGIADERALSKAMKVALDLIKNSN